MRRNLNPVEHGQVTDVVDANADGHCAIIASKIAERLDWVARCHYKLAVQFRPELGDEYFVQRYLVLRTDGSWGEADKVLRDKTVREETT